MESEFLFINLKHQFVHISRRLLFFFVCLGFGCTLSRGMITLEAEKQRLIVVHVDAVRQQDALTVSTRLDPHLGTP